MNHTIKERYTHSSVTLNSAVYYTMIVNSFETQVILGPHSRNMPYTDEIIRVPCKQGLAVR